MICWGVHWKQPGAMAGVVTWLSSSTATRETFSSAETCAGVNPVDAESVGGTGLAIQAGQNEGCGTSSWDRRAAAVALADVCVPLHSSASCSRKSGPKAADLVCDTVRGGGTTTVFVAGILCVAVGVCVRACNTFFVCVADGVTGNGRVRVAVAPDGVAL